MCNLCGKDLFRTCLPVVPHTAVVEVSKIDNYSRKGEWLWCMDGAKPLMDRKLVGAVLFEMVALVTSPTAAECSVVWCSVVECSGSRSRSWSVVYARVSAQICLSEQWRKLSRTRAIFQENGTFEICESQATFLVSLFVHISGLETNKFLIFFQTWKQDCKQNHVLFFKPSPKKICRQETPNGVGESEDNVW